MTEERLTAILAQRVMGWTVGADRFTMGNRGWTPRWRFQPAEKLDDAFRLLDEAAPQEFSICGNDKGRVHVCVRIGGNTGEAEGTSRPRAITIALARALRVEVDE